MVGFRAKCALVSARDRNWRVQAYRVRIAKLREYFWLSIYLIVRELRSPSIASYRPESHRDITEISRWNALRRTHTQLIINRTK